ncbi:hypothetical protein VaNZ11_015441 [Volvox africanus]|uniref:K Homology domain-containing protein n=1 Tax=Volvox africanus TaxID=51714 RepID=A0ABQ5SLM2_9CHLO|nr:hypothetical protein VaNZ11_015441 [Volvox africanus]
MIQNRTNVTKIPIPLGIWVGHLVGRRGVNMRWLHIQSGGAHITANDAEVIIRSRDSHVRARAVKMVRRQLNAMLRFGAHDTRLPFHFDYVLLESAFGCDPRVGFFPRNDEVANSVVKKDKLFQLVPMSRSVHEGRSTRSTTVTNETMAVGGDGGAGYIGSGRCSDSGSVNIVNAALISHVTCRVTTATRTNTCGCGCDVTAGDQFKVDMRWPPTPQDLSCAREKDPAPVPFTSPTLAIATTHNARVMDASGAGSPATVMRFHAASTASGNCSCSANGGPKSRGRDGEGSSSDARLLRPLMPVAETLAVAARAAVEQKPGFDMLKMRFHLGKHMFRNLGARAGRRDLSVLELQGAGAGRGCFQSVFSTWVPSSAVPRVTSWLTDSLGFCLADTKTTATLHVINQELNIHYSIALAMERGDESTSSLRKVKVGGSGSRFHSVSLLAAPKQLDLRLKLVGQSNHWYGQEGNILDSDADADAHSTARRVAAAVRMEGFEGFTRSKRGLPRNRHLEYARHKTKFVYEGYLPTSGGGGQRLRVSVTQVQDDKGTHFEISGCLPDADAQLRQLLTQQQRPAAVAADPSDEFVPEWRRRGRSASSTGRCGVSGSVVHDSANSTPTRTRATTTHCPSLDLHPWAVASLIGLSDFITKLNRHLDDEMEGVTE